MAVLSSQWRLAPHFLSTNVECRLRRTPDTAFAFFPPRRVSLRLRLISQLLLPTTYLQLDPLQPRTVLTNDLHRNPEALLPSSKFSKSSPTRRRDGCQHQVPGGAYAGPRRAGELFAGTSVLPSRQRQRLGSTDGRGAARERGQHPR